MGLNHLEKYFTDKAGPYIEAAGGKIGGLNYLKATVPGLRDAILPVQVVKPNERVKEIKVPAGEDGRFIVRGSHWMDFQGLVDVLDTQVGDEYVDELVQEVQAQAKFPYIMAYGRYENPAYDGKAFVGVQPYLDCQRGSIIEHPNVPHHYVISFVDQRYQTGTDSVTTVIYNTTKDHLERISGYLNEVTGNDESDITTRVKQVVGLYKQVDAAGLVKPGLSFQMEFLNAPEQVFIAQIRAFMKKEQAKFELDARRRLVFGITPPEGIVLPVFLSPDGFIRGDCPNPNSQWAYLKPCELSRYSGRYTLHPQGSEEQKIDALRFQPRQLAAYLIGQSLGSQVNTSLDHNHFRIVQMADLTIFERDTNNVSDILRGNFTRLFYPNSGFKNPREAHENLCAALNSMADRNVSFSDIIRSTFQGRVMCDARIISDGRTATVEPILRGKSGR